eukprot:m.344630 g.344630  ORF g.344630 m.344630 type:complete len:208 (-) comp16552_c0_seq8:2626-3249(-)
MAATVPSSSRLREVHYSEEVVAAAAELRIEPRRGIATVVDPELADMIGKAFARADSGGKGWLTREDLEVASVAVLGFTLSVDALFQDDLDKEHDDTSDARTSDTRWLGLSRPTTMTPLKFRQVMLRELRSAQAVEDSRQTFRFFDLSSRGFISFEDFQATVRQHAPGLSFPTVEAAFRELDTDHDGRVSFGDFDAMFRSQPLPQQYL